MLLNTFQSSLQLLEEMQLVNKAERKITLSKNKILTELSDKSFRTFSLPLLLKCLKQSAKRYWCLYRKNQFPRNCSQKATCFEFFIYKRNRIYLEYSVVQNSTQKVLGKVLNIHVHTQNIVIIRMHSEKQQYNDPDDK